tara:strand:+ start:914 stop:1486 length:573 start_codon:yes stop_codon:yes gene_type:complete
MSDLLSRCQDLNPTLDWCDPNAAFGSEAGNEEAGSFVGAALIIENPTQGIAGAYRRLSCASCGEAYEPGKWIREARRLSAILAEAPAGWEEGKNPDAFRWTIDGGAFLLVERLEDENKGFFRAELRRSEAGNTEGTSNALLASSGPQPTPEKAMAVLWGAVRDAGACWEQWIGFLEWSRRNLGKLPEWVE